MGLDGTVVDMHGRTFSIVSMVRHRSEALQDEEVADPLRPHRNT